MKQRIKLTESDLHRMIKESVRQVLKESYSTDSMVYDNIDKMGNEDVSKLSTEQIYQNLQYMDAYSWALRTEWCRDIYNMYSDEYSYRMSNNR